MEGIGFTAFVFSAILGMATYSLFGSFIWNLIKPDKQFTFIKITLYTIILVTFVLFVYLNIASQSSMPGDDLYKIYIYMSLPVLPNSVLGFVWGLLAGVWIQYALNPKFLRTPSINTAHRRWGVALLVLAFLPPVANLLPSLVTRLLSVEGPGFALTLSANPSNSQDSVYLSDPGPGAASEFTILKSERYLSFIGAISQHMATDEAIIETLSEGDKKASITADVKRSSRPPHDQALQRAQIEPTRTDYIQSAFDYVFTPLAACIKELNNIYNNPFFIHTKISDFVFALSINEFKSAQKNLNKLKNLGDLSKAPSCEAPANHFGIYEKRIRELFENKPYGAMLIAFLSGGGAAYETAAIELARWLDKNHDREGKDRVHEWHLIRAEIYLDIILNSLGQHAARARILERSVNSYETLLSGSDLLWQGNIANWCEALQNNKSVGQISTKIIFSYINQIKRLIEANLKSNGFHDAHLIYAETIAEIELGCIREAISTPPLALIYKAELLVDYAEGLLTLPGHAPELSNLRREPSALQRDLARRKLRAAQGYISEAEKLATTSADGNKPYTNALSAGTEIDPLKARLRTLLRLTSG